LEAMNESLLGTHDLGFLTRHWAMAILISLGFLILTRWLEGKLQHRLRINGELSKI
jgi:hypothetical protein